MGPYVQHLSVVVGYPLTDRSVALGRGDFLGSRPTTGPRKDLLILQFKGTGRDGYQTVTRVACASCPVIHQFPPTFPLDASAAQY